MATLEITLGFSEPGTEKSDELISRQKGVPYDAQSRAAVDELKLRLAKAVMDWRDDIAKTGPPTK